MSDASLRAAERQWQKSGLARDEASFVQQALRTLSDDRRKLVQSVVCEEIRTLLGVATEPNFFRPLSWVEFPARDQSEALFHELGVEPALRIGIAVARFTLGRWEQVFPRDLRPREAIEAAEDWLLCPCSDHAARCARRANYTDAATDHGWETPEPVAADEAAMEAEACARMAADPRPEAWFYDVVGNRLRPSPHMTELPEWSEVLPAVRAELLPWLCGTGDPLAERVAGRAANPR